MVLVAEEKEIFIYSFSQMFSTAIGNHMGQRFTAHYLELLATDLRTVKAVKLVK